MELDEEPDRACWTYEVDDLGHDHGGMGSVHVELSGERGPDDVRQLAGEDVDDAPHTWLGGVVRQEPGRNASLVELDRSLVRRKAVGDLEPFAAQAVELDPDARGPAGFRQHPFADPEGRLVAH